MSPVVAVVATYRPDAESLLALIDDLARDGITTIVVDDGSPCTFDPLLREVAGRVAAETPVTVQRFGTNHGIARSLNAGVTTAQALKAPWLLTLDQDTRLPVGVIEQLLATAERAKKAGLVVGAIGPIIGDASGGDIKYPTREVNGFATTAEIVQSGAIWSVAALQEIDGFDERLGIDAVDAAACLNLRQIDYQVLVDGEARITHRVGNARAVQVLGRTVLATGHSADRRTTMVRNRLRLAPAEFMQSPIQGLRSLRRLAVSTALAVTVEDDRWAKAKASARGLFPKRRG
ncbi:unannotated protein [freshwater metagenome]|uniref:Unannotated protein n=1 Tax=freshwater metagenome TaxID=449393 RepID=A0A6J7P3K4_9ZZZZ